MVGAARGLRALVEDVEAIVPSPLLRAIETAHILGATYGLAPEDPLRALEPDRPPHDSLDPLRTLSRRAGTVALVGHEPQLAALAALLLADAPTPFFALRKGGACLLEVAGAPRPGHARLQWLAPAKLLRTLGGRGREH